MPGSAVKEVIRATPEAAAHQKSPDGLSDEYIFFRMQQWLDDGDKGITFNHILTRFKTYPTRAIWLLHKFYFDHHEFYNLKRGWFVEPEVREDVNDDGNMIEFTGFTATEAQIEEMEKDGKIVKKRLFCIHPASLDSIERIDFFNSQRMDSNARKPLSILFESDATAVKKEKETEKRNEAAKLQKLFDKECERPKHADPSGKNKYKTPPKAINNFFSPSPSRKQKDATTKPSPLKARRIMNLEPSKNDAMMDDVFTTGEDDIDMEDIGANTNELVENKKAMKPSKIAASNYRPKKVSSRVPGLPQIASDALNEDAEMEEPDEEAEAGPSTAPTRIKELRTVQETTQDDEGFLVTRTSKKMVETDKTMAPPPPKKKAAVNPPASKKAKAAPKQQSTLTDFFKRK
uniref:DNA polymerase delta subunit 3 n=1 Tax=Panagrolaimus sp. ES5 TaxID=591445 RepID=A0AC34F1U7_9BILA